MTGASRAHAARIAALVVLLAIGTAAGQANACGPRVDVQHQEDSPDVFQVTFVSGKEFELQTLDIDMSSSVGGVYIDDIYDPPPANRFSLAKVVKIENAAEGGQTARLVFRDFLAGRSLSYWMDLDDQSSAGGGNYDHLTSGEIKGARASAVLRHSNGRLERIEGTFTKNGIAILAPRACV